MGQLTNQFVSQSYQGLLKLEDSTTGVTGNLQYVTDGLGNRIPMLASTSSIVITGSFRGDGSGLTGITANVDSSSLVTTSSFNAYTSSVDSHLLALDNETGSLQLEINQKLDTGSFNSYTSSNDTKVNSLINATGSYATTSSLTSLSQSIAVTDLAQDGRLTSIEGVTGSFATTSSLTSLSQSIAVTDLAQDGRLGSLESATGSLQNQINQKLDTGSFNTYSGDTLNLINQKLDSGSFNSYTSSNDTKVNDLISKTGSYATTGSNVFNGTQTISGSLNVTGEITALSASITYLETIFQTSSIIFSSGSNILGDEASDTQTLNGRVDIPLGNLNVTGATTSSLGFFGNLQGTASFATNALSSSHSVNADTASYVLNAVSSSYSDFAVSSSQAQNAVSASHSINSDNSISSSFAQAAISSSHSVNSDTAISSSFAQDAISSSFATNALSASYAPQDPLPSGLVSSSAQISYTGITDVPSGIISGSGQIDGLGYATTSSVNQKLDTGSFNAYTSSNDAKVNSLINATSSYVTEAESGSFMTTGSVAGDTLTFTKGDGSQFSLQVSVATGSLPSGVVSGSQQIVDLGFATTSSLSGYTTVTDFNSYTSSTDGRLNSIEGATGSYVTETESGSFMTTGSVSGNVLTFTKGDGSTFNLSVDTGSVTPIDTSSFATTGSNTFVGDQTITGSLNVSGRSSLDGPLSSTDSLIKLFSAASLGGTVQPGQFLTASAPVSQSNIVFAPVAGTSGQGPILPGQTGSIQISGSNNILFTSNRVNSPLGLVGYLSSNNIGNVIPTLNTSSVYRPGVSNNLLYGPINMTMGSGSGVPSISNNIQFGTTTLNVPSSSAGGTYATNTVVGALTFNEPNTTQAYSIQANNIAGFVTMNAPISYTGSTVTNTLQQNIINGTIVVQHNSGSFQATSNTINGATIAVTSSYRSTVAASNGVTFNNNSINGLNHRILFDGVATGAKGFNNSLIVGGNNTASLVTNDTNGISNTGLIGQGLYVESGNASGAGGSLIVGRYNETGSLANPGQYKFIIGNGTGPTNRLTSLALDGATNTFTFNSNTIMTGSISPLDVRGTILTKRIHFDGNPFNNDPASNLGAIRMDSFNRTLQYTNYDKAQLSTQSFIDQIVDTGSLYTSTIFGAAYAGTVARIEAVNNNGTRRVDVKTDTMTVTGSLDVTAGITGSLEGTASFATTASFALNAVSTDTGSLMKTGSVSGNVLTFTKGDGTTFDLTVATGSGGGSAFPFTGSAQITGSLGVTGSLQVLGDQRNTGSFRLGSGDIEVTAGISNGIFINGTGGAVNRQTQFKPGRIEIYSDVKPQVLLNNLNTGSIFLDFNGQPSDNRNNFRLALNKSDGGTTVNNQNTFTIGNYPSSLGSDNFIMMSGSLSSSSGSYMGFGSDRSKSSLGNYVFSNFDNSQTRVFVSGSVTIANNGDLTMYGHKMFNVGAFSSLETQSGSAAVSQSVNFGTTDVSNGVTVASNSRVTFANAGTYSITFSAQIKADGGQDTMWMWLKKNGTNVPNTSTKIIGKNNEETVLTVNYVVEVASSDYYELAWENLNGYADLLYESGSGNYPAIPSVILTAVQVR